MAKEQKTTSELEDLIRNRATTAGVHCFVKVAPEAGYGWHATATADPRVVIDYQRRIGEIVAELRAEFDLKP